MMIQYLYKLDYTAPTQNTVGGINGHLWKQIDCREPQADPEPGAAVEGPASGSPREECTTPPLVSVPPGFELTFHARVYTLAEKCWVDDLKQVALLKFKSAASRGWALDDLASAAQEVYTRTIDTDRGLRDIVVEAMCGRAGIMKDEGAQDLVKEVPALGYDMIMYMHQQYRF